ncbi:MAG: hypothetical protein P4L45_17460 [Ignavibacteriaceae bacterium]|nr:hypothetical protein [Ignavibacteriaceae bacterium]
MKNSDKIILYLDGQMSAEEKTAFEEELNNSQPLRDELKLLTDFNSGIKGMKNIPVEEDYFVQMVPKFRGRAERKKKFRLFPGIAYSVTTATAVFIVMFFVMNNNTKNDNIAVQNNTSKIVNIEPVQDASALSDQFDLVSMNRDEAAGYDTLLNSMLIRELGLTPQSLSEISAPDNNTTDIQTILQGVDEKEIDAIYKEILHKKIL